MKNLISLFILSLIFLVAFQGCNSTVDVITVNSAPKNCSSDYWRDLSIAVLDTVKLPGTKVKKVDHSYCAGIRVDYAINAEKLLAERPSDAVIVSCLIKEDNEYGSLIYTDDFDGLKRWLQDN